MVGSTEAQAIALQLEKIVPPRPLTHDLMKNLLESVDVNISRIVVNELRENTYFAVIGLQKNGASKSIDARPSDAIALALRVNAPIFVEEDVMQKASITEKDAQIDDIEDDYSPGDRLEQLNVELRSAVQDERYEEAAKIRDEIRKIKEDLRDSS